MEPEHQLPSYVIRICYDIIAEETANHAALERVLQLAGLERYGEYIPPLNNTPAITIAGDPYIVVAISKNEVVFSAKSNNKRTPRPYTTAP